jgi:hypothetical protein
MRQDSQTRDLPRHLLLPDPSDRGPDPEPVRDGIPSAAGAVRSLREAAEELLDQRRIAVAGGTWAET